MRARAAAEAAAVLLCAAVASVAAVLFVGFVYLAATGGPWGRTLAWAVGLGVGAVVLMGVVGALDGDDDGDGEAETAEADGEVRDAVEAASAKSAGKPAPPAWGETAFAIGLVVGLVAGGAGGVFGYQALTGTAPAPAAHAGPTPSASASASVSPSPSRSAASAGAAWQVAARGPTAGKSPAVWGLGDAVVHVRLDGLSAYAVEDGAVRWTSPAPAREAVCATSVRAERGVGLVAYGRHGKPCATLVAVRASDGKALWQRRVGGAGVATGLGHGTLAVAGATALAVEDGAVRARSAETGAERWRRALGAGCGAQALDATAERTLLVEQCGGATARLVALDTVTGEESWTARLPVETPTQAFVVSVRPAVVAIREEDARGTRALLGYDDKGRGPTVTVPISGPAGNVVMPMGMWASSAGEGRPVVVGDALIALAATRNTSLPDAVIAHSLTDGHLLWRYGPEGTSFDALARADDGRVAVLEGSRGTRILTLDATGTLRGALDAPAAPRPPTVAELVPVTGGHVVVNIWPRGPEPSLYLLR
ncbi:PQQ-binding-like beta-propeller repeat protein [Streptomyces sp. NPDC048629]|uniref:outer membrane protein assembly factor BamB family protein n=1 Tax=Streptomyces sp. NPDC048629 TaxID=3154824 RepID=UPI003441DEC8